MILGPRGEAQRDNSEMSAAYWRALIMKNPSTVEYWEGLVGVYQNEFAAIPPVEDFPDKLPLEGLRSSKSFSNN